MISTNDSAPAANRPKFYLTTLMLLLCVATLCEGYDFFIVSLVLKRLSVDFNKDIFWVICTLGVINGGGVLGFFAIRLGDKIGRKPVLIAGVIGYGSLSLVTAFTPNLTSYLIVQFFTKIFLVTEFGTAIIMVSEEFSAKRRGTNVAILEVAGAIGGGAAMMLSTVIIPAWGWRGMYKVGVAPLFLVPFMILYIKETTHFLKLRSGEVKAQPSLMAIWSSKSKKYILPVGMLWFLGYLSYAGVIYFWPLFAETERGLTIAQIGPKITIASAVGMSGYVISGAMMDLIGRKPTGIMFFLASAVSLIWAFTAHGELMIPAIVMSMFFIFALLPINSTFNAELFPTEHRAASSAWCNALIGRPAQVVAPFVVGFMSRELGSIGGAVCLLAAGPLVAAILIFLIFPETKGIKLDEI